MTARGAHLRTTKEIEQTVVPRLFSLAGVIQKPATQSSRLRLLAKAPVTKETTRPGGLTQDQIDRLLGKTTKHCHNTAVGFTSRRRDKTPPGTETTLFTVGTTGHKTKKELTHATYRLVTEALSTLAVQDVLSTEFAANKALTTHAESICKVVAAGLNLPISADTLKTRTPEEAAATRKELMAKVPVKDRARASRIIRSNEVLARDMVSGFKTLGL